MSGRTLAYVALCLFLVSWFIPVHVVLDGDTGGPYGASPTLGIQAGTPPGVRAVERTWLMLVREGDSWLRVVLGTTCFTNVAMLLAVLALLVRSQPRWLGYLLLFCAVLNAGWLYLLIGDPGFIAGLGPGYYFWLISFWLAGLAFLRSTPARQRRRITEQADA